MNPIYYPTMQVTCKSPFQAEISLKDSVIHVIGSTLLLATIAQLRKTNGNDPRKWPELEVLKTEDDLLINEFILKCKSEFKLAYEHAELCHCRMITAEKVFDSIKQGCRTIEDVGRTTLAGTGCGSCRPDIEKLLTQFRLTPN